MELRSNINSTNQTSFSIPKAHTSKIELNVELDERKKVFEKGQALMIKAYEMMI